MGVEDDLLESRGRLFALVLDLDDEEWMGPKLPIVNPIRWEIGHVAWFQERWVLRHALGRAPIRADGDALYDSSHVPHDTRWDLPLPSRAETIAYMNEVLTATCAAAVQHGGDPKIDYFLRLALFHEDMHGEAITYTRQTLAYPRALVADSQSERFGSMRVPPDAQGDVEIPGVRGFLLGAREGDDPFVFDNEKWAHPIDVASFHMARTPVTNAQFAEFVLDDGYERDELWSDEGLAWRRAHEAKMPVYWQRATSDARGTNAFVCRRFGVRTFLPSEHPIIHVSWFEAEAYCRWAKRRLPTEAEWELAASTEEKRRFPWGNEPPTNAYANLDALAAGTLPVSACALGDSREGVRQMIGNVWEWTSTRFAPYPGFVVDPYEDYSRPWFDTPHMVLRGGCWATRARLLRNTYRNFYPPGRRDVLAGFRTCALT